jgi:hypothetical protein
MMLHSRYRSVVVPRCDALRPQREKVAHYGKEAVDVRNKVDKWKRQRDGAVHGLGCGEHGSERFLLD